MLGQYRKEFKPQNMLQLLGLISANAIGLVRYRLRQLKTATDNFSHRNLVGESELAKVYRGWLGDRTVAIKRLKLKDDHGSRVQEFAKEIVSTGRLYHRNLIPLVGYCSRGTELLFVYEFACNNSLDNQLRPGRRENLDWNTRKKIILGTARGLAYLHDGCKPGIVHGSIGADTVLLDSDFEAKIVGVGNAYCSTHSFSSSEGFFGYVDPLYISYGEFNFKTDVYSFGILLLELITGLRARSKEFAEVRYKLEKTVRDKKFDDLVDHSLQIDHDYNEMTRIVVCAAASICPSQDDRPTIKQIISVLEGYYLPDSFIRQKISSYPPAIEQRSISPLHWKEETCSTFSTHDEETFASPCMTDDRGHERISSLQLPLSAETTFGLMRFTLYQLETATNNFSPLDLIGEGGFSKVYRGNLSDRVVAIKKLIHESTRGDDDFKTEMDAISQVNHKNLISLIGYCIEGTTRVLVYEFAENYSLAYHLKPGRRQKLDWETRKRILLGTARGLAYLHDGCKMFLDYANFLFGKMCIKICNPSIYAGKISMVHRDIKTANILLDSKFEAKIADLGIAKLYPNSSATHESTLVKGTLGYIDPHYFQTGKLTYKSDVYSFGILLLVLITGNGPSEKLEEAKCKLKRALIKREFDDLVDEYLDNDYDLDDLTRMVACAAVCISQSPNDRPAMKEVVNVLQGDKSPNGLIRQYVGNRLILKLACYIPA